MASTIIKPKALLLVKQRKRIIDARLLSLNELQYFLAKTIIRGETE
jgi:hypothetical protein